MQAKKQAKKYIALLLSALLILSAFTACGSSSTSSTSTSTATSSTETTAETAAESAEEAEAAEEIAEDTVEEAAEETVETVTLNVAYMPNYGSLWAVLVAIDQGYFADVNLEVNLVEFADGPTIIAAMEGGSIDFGYIGQGAHKLCVQGNATIICMSHIGNGDAVIGGETVSCLEDLAGKVVAYSSGTSSETILLNALASVGLSMDDITAMDMDATTMVSAMLSGSVDACAVWSPSSLTILEESSSCTLLCDNATFADSTVSISSWIATPSYLEENEAVAIRFVQALLQAMDYGAQEENYEYVAQLVAEQCATDYDTAYAQRGDGQWYTAEMLAEAIADGSMEAYYQLQQDTFLAAGSIEQGDVCAVSDYVAFDIMSAALELLE